MKKIPLMMLGGALLVGCSPEVEDLTYGTEGWDRCASQVMSRMKSDVTIEDGSIELLIDGIRQEGNQVTGYVAYQSILDTVFGEESTYRYTCTFEEGQVVDTELSSATPAR